VSWRVTNKAAGYQLRRPRRAGSVVVGKASLDFGHQCALFSIDDAPPMSQPVINRDLEVARLVKAKANAK
jgi:hypothetical protein